MTYQLVLQWAASAMDDYDVLIRMEDLLIDRLADKFEVDGHDLGSGEMNLFIDSPSPEHDFVLARDALTQAGFTAPTSAGFRNFDDDDYTALWPPGAAFFSVA